MTLSKEDRERMETLKEKLRTGPCILPQLRKLHEKCRGKEDADARWGPIPDKCKTCKRNRRTPMDKKITDLFPKVLGFGDYHEIDEHARLFSSLIGHHVYRREVAFDGRYWGVFWIGQEKKPSRETIKTLLLQAGWDETLEESELRV